MYRFLILVVFAVGCSKTCDEAKAEYGRFVDANRACAADSDCVTPPSCGAALNRAADPNTCSRLWSQVVDSCDYHMPMPACFAACDVDAGVCICGR